MEIWVHLETSPGGGENEADISAVSLELLAAARELAENAGSVSAFAMGGNLEPLAATAGNHGASRLHHLCAAGDELVGPPLAAALAERFANSGSPDALLFGTSYDGRDTAGRLSARIGVPVITNITELAVDSESLIGVEPVFGGTTNVSTRFVDVRPQIFLVRPKSFAPAAVGGASAEITALPEVNLPTAGAARVVKRHAEQSDGPKLDEASVIVSGGRGLGSAEGFEMVAELAEALGGAAGASRAIVDAGWVPYSYQIGQTGKVVKPDVYIACGISGATQHLVGMKNSKAIIAINKDPDAPIFSVADLGVVGDIHKVLPKLLTAIKAR